MTNDAGLILAVIVTLVVGFLTGSTLTNWAWRHSKSIERDGDTYYRD
jgi:hypothetical protein